MRLGLVATNADRKTLVLFKKKTKFTCLYNPYYSNVNYQYSAVAYWLGTLGRVSVFTPKKMWTRGMTEAPLSKEPNP